MAEAVHFAKSLTSRHTNTTDWWATSLTVAASDLTTAGFAANDEVVVIYYVSLSSSDPSAGKEPMIRLLYNGSDIGPTTNTWPAQYDHDTSGIERSHMWMERVDLGSTVAAFELQNNTANASNSVYTERAEIFVLRLSDLGTENTDWFWNQVNDTTTTDFPTTWGSKASVTFTPGSVEDWVVLGTVHANNDNSANSHQCRLALDGSAIAGEFKEEGESNNEHKRWVLFDLIPSLSAASHTIAWQNQADTTATMDHSRSSILVFKAGTFADIYIHEPGTVSCSASTNVQVATITDTLSATQDILMLGNGNFNGDADALDGYMWIRQDGTTVIDPTMDQSGGLQTLRTFDATDESQAMIMAYLAGESGALDLDLFFYHNASGARDLLSTKFLVWGMELAGGVTVVTGTANGTTTATGSVTPAVTVLGSASGSVVASGSVSGLAEVQASASGTTTSVGAVTPVIEVQASAAGTTTSSGTVTGETAVEGSASGTTTSQGSVTAAITVEGSAPGTTTAQGTVSALVETTGTASGSTTAQGSVTALVETTGVSSGTTTSTGTVTGETAVEGSASGTTTATGTVSGLVEVQASAAGTTTSSGTASAAVTVEGTAAGSVTASGSVSALIEVQGSATGTVTSSGFVDGTVIVGGADVVEGVAAGTTTSIGAASAFVIVEGIAHTWTASRGFITDPPTHRHSTVEVGG